MALKLGTNGQKPHHVFRAALLGALVAVAVFEVMLRVLRLPQDLSAEILGVAMIPALIAGFVWQVGALLSDPDRLPHTIGYAFGTIALIIVFFAFMYRELGIVAPNDPAAREVTSFTTCLYFSASTITTAGLGDFVPMPEARIMAALEMVIGYVSFGIVTAASFFLIEHRSRKP